MSKANHRNELERQDDLKARRHWAIHRAFSAVEQVTGGDLVAETAPNQAPVAEVPEVPVQDMVSDKVVSLAERMVQSSGLDAIHAQLDAVYDQMGGNNGVQEFNDPNLAEVA